MMMMMMMMMMRSSDLWLRTWLGLGSGLALARARISVREASGSVLGLVRVELGAHGLLERDREDLLHPQLR